MKKSLITKTSPSQPNETWTFATSKGDSMLSEAALDSLNRMCFGMPLSKHNYSLLGLCYKKMLSKSEKRAGIFVTDERQRDVEAVGKILNYGKTSKDKLKPISEDEFTYLCDSLHISANYPAANPTNSFKIMQELEKMDLKEPKDTGKREDPLIGIKNTMKEMLSTLVESPPLYSSHIDATASGTAKENLTSLIELIERKYSNPGTLPEVEIRALQQLLTESWNQPAYLYINDVGMRLNMLKVKMYTDEITDYWVPSVRHDDDNY